MGIGSVYAARGSMERAQAELAAAIDQFRGMEMSLWQKRARAVFKSLSRESMNSPLQVGGSARRSPGGARD